MAPASKSLIDAKSNLPSCAASVMTLAISARRSAICAVVICASPIFACAISATAAFRLWMSAHRMSALMMFAVVISAFAMVATCAVSVAICAQSMAAFLMFAVVSCATAMVARSAYSLSASISPATSCAMWADTADRALAASCSTAATAILA